MYKKYGKNAVDETEIENNDASIFEEKNEAKIDDYVVEELEITSGNGCVFVDKTSKSYDANVVKSEEENKEEKPLKNDGENKTQQNKKFFETFFYHFNSIFRSKNGKKLIILLVCVVLFISFVLIYGVATKYTVSSVFQNEVNAFVKNNIGDSGQGQVVALKISDLESEKKNNDLYYNYQYIEMYGKDLNKNKKLGTLNFSVATEKDVTINVALVIKKNDTEILNRFDYVVAKKGAYAQCELSIQNKIDDFNGEIKMIITFAKDTDVRLNIFNMYWTTY